MHCSLLHSHLILGECEIDAENSNILTLAEANIGATQSRESTPYVVRRGVYSASTVHTDHASCYVCSRPHSTSRTDHTHLVILYNINLSLTKHHIVWFRLSLIQNSPSRFGLP